MERLLFEFREDGPRERGPSGLVDRVVVVGVRADTESDPVVAPERGKGVLATGDRISACRIAHCFELLQPEADGAVGSLVRRRPRVIELDR